MGRKQTKPAFLKQNQKLQETTNMSARNLRKDKLGSVIFGCKNHTIAECLEKKIFGLPIFHQSYVKNILPGLTLFLFNYTDRTLHGIYEAATHGQLCIDKYAWTSSEGASITPYPAQVRINVRRPCQPLHEEAFKSVIARNYYTDRFFWFELDRAQTAKLTSLFLSSPIPEKPRIPISGVPGSSLHGANAGMRQHNEQMENHKHSNASFHVERDMYAPEKKWSELFQVSVSATVDAKVLERKLSSSSNQVGQYHPEACTESADSSITNNLEELVDMDTDLKNQCIPEKKWSELFKTSSAMENAKGSGASTVDSFIRDTWEEFADMDSDVGFLYATVHEQECEKDSDLQDATSLDVRTSVPLVAVEAAEAVLDSEEESETYDYVSVITKLRKEIEGLKLYQLHQYLKVDSLEQELADTKVELYQLKKQCQKLGSSVSCNDDYSDEGVVVNPNSMFRESVLVVGGYDGSSWVKDVNLYSPSEDIVKSLCPTTFPRSYAAVSNLNNEIYLIGGVHDGVWYDTVESYNPLSNQWVQRPSLNKKKGSIAGASINGKIYAIGGGNGVECFAEVELFDINVPRWMYTKSMLEKRFAPAAVEMNGALYVTGGYDGRNYLSSAERFDPREGSWGVLFSMDRRRGGHSMVVYKEKLYALGGYDEARMVSSVEVFDPRIGLWETVEPMTASRGYFGAFPIDGKIYVIGGLDENNEVLDVVESYEEGMRWQRVANSSALGKRCFFSSLLL